jgi:hypothetical protein
VTPSVERTQSTLERTSRAPRRVWFRVEEVEISWLPVDEAAFLLWVLVLLIAGWLGAGVALGLV